MSLTKRYGCIVIIGIVSLFFASCANSEILINKELKKKIQMEQKEKKIMEFVPPVFNSFKNGIYGEYSKLSLLPLFTEHTILLVIPSQITYYIKGTKIGKKKLMLPLTFGYEAQEEFDGLDNIAKVYVKDLNLGKTYSGKMVYSSPIQFEPDPDPSYPKNMDISTAVPLSGQENYDVLEYVDLPIKSGKYEAYVTLLGLKSNVVKFEIIVKTLHPSD